MLSADLGSVLDIRKVREEGLRWNSRCADSEKPLSPLLVGMERAFFTTMPAEGKIP